MRLPKRQQECFDFIRDFKASNGYSPTVREIMAHMGIKSPNGVVCHLKALQRKGLIEWTEEKARSITIVGESDGWIRTTERLPDNGSRVIGYWPHGMETTFFSEGDWLFFDGDCVAKPPTHWMPLPKPPQETEPCMNPQT